ncbi:Formate dehydrogenase [termite gut metagenome]|uniref:Formate dehydrogenase n=1 Tax=termite gut metagenome TaxID=433724 RepID=A0A5J4RCI6_9ZZZZ
MLGSSNTRIDVCFGCLCSRLLGSGEIASGKKLRETVVSSRHNVCYVLKVVNSAKELYQLCDVVSLHIPATAETKSSINYDLLKNLSKGAILVNTARKEVINESELIKFMEERTDFKYVTDIMPAAHDRFTELFAGRYFSTPQKTGAQTAEANINAGIAAAKQIVGFLKDGCEKFRVNKK